VTYVQPTSALAAYEALDRKSFQGRLLHILAAVDRKGRIQVGEGEAKKTLKDERNLKRKATAGKEFNWSMLYMNVRRLFPRIKSFSVNLLTDICNGSRRATPLLRLSRIG
jgi:hypothetical protein